MRIANEIEDLAKESISQEDVADTDLTEAQPEVADSAHAPAAATGTRGKAAIPPAAMLPIDQIKKLPSVQPRTGVHMATVRDYAAAMKDGVTFPPIVVFRNADGYTLADGFHRVAAAEKAQILQLPVEIHEGDNRQAFLYAVSANSCSSRPFTRPEKRQAALRLLADPEWCKWTDTVIARRCGVSSRTVGRWRKSTSDNVRHAARQYVRGNKTICADTTNLGRKKTAVNNDSSAQEMEGPDRELAETEDEIDAACPTDLLEELQDVLNRAGDVDLVHAVVAIPDGIRRISHLVELLRTRAGQWAEAIQHIENATGDELSSESTRPTYGPSQGCDE